MARTFSRPVQLLLDHERRILWAMALFPVVAVALIAIFKLMPHLYAFIVREDSIVEWATAVVYLTAAVFAASLALHFWRCKEKSYGLLYGILTVGMFFVALEEISWGQRQLGFEPPAIVTEVNSKHEFNFHNIPIFPLHAAYIVVGLYGAFSRLMAVLLLRGRYPKAVDLLTPPCILCLYFLLPAIYYIYNQYLYYTDLLPNGLEWSEYWTDEDFVVGKDQEPLELLLSFGFLAFAVLNWVRYRVGAPLALPWSAAAASRPPDGASAARHRVSRR